MAKIIDYGNVESMLSVNVNHMWRHSSGINLEGQIKIRKCRVEILKEKGAPEIILGPEIKKLNVLLRKQERESNK